MTCIFGNPKFCISEFYVAKSLVCCNVNAVLPIAYELQGKRTDTLALYAFLQRLNLHTFNYMIISYGLIYEDGKDPFNSE